MSTQLPDIIAKYVFLALIQADPGLIEQELMERCCESMYMDYFHFVSIREELLKKGLATTAQRKNEVQKDIHGKEVFRWDLTAEGEALLHHLSPSIPDGVLRYLNQCNRQHSPAGNAAVAYTEPTGHGEYWAVLCLQEQGQTRFELRLALSDLDLAERICLKWRNNAETQYPSILSALLPESPQKL